MGSASRGPAHIDATAAAMLIQDGQTIAGDGFGMMGVADEVYAALECRFGTSGSPRGLTLVHTSGQSNRTAGISRFAYEGLLKRVVGAHWGRTPRISDLIAENKIEAVCLPQGQLAALYRATAAGRPGIMSSVGLNTFVDPQHEGGRVNEITRKRVPASEYVERVSLNGEDYLLYKTHPIDVAIIRGTSADRVGNLSQSEEAVGLDSLALAQSAKNTGGIVIAQVLNIVDEGEIIPRDVVVPGNLIDYLVVCSDPDEYHRQANYTVRDATLISRVHESESGDNGEQPPQVAEHRLDIGRRAIALVRPGDVLNAGTGIPGDSIGNALRERGLTDVEVTLESGVYGGTPLGALDFGAAHNPSAIITQADQFNFYNGGGIDVAFMGVGQFTVRGEVNVSKLGERVVGVGGFLDILDRARTVCFMLDCQHVAKKLVEQVDHLSFDGQWALQKGQRVYLVCATSTYILQHSGWQLVDESDSQSTCQLTGVLARKACGRA